FEDLPLGWDRAFGGAVELPPHRTAEGLPHPGGRVMYSLNPGGRGLCVESAPVSMEGTLLPNIEDPRALVRSPGDLRLPHGIAPCRELYALRCGISERAAWSRAMPTKEVLELPIHQLAREAATPLSALHHAPPSLLFEEPLAAGTPIELVGHRGPPIALGIPACAARVRTRSLRTTVELEPRIRSVHL